MKNKTTKEDEIIAGLIRIVEEVENDPEVAKKAADTERETRKGKPALDDFIGK